MQDTARTRKAIRMARVGMPEHQIAFMLGLDLSELRARYASRMRRAAIDANLEIWETLWSMARSGQNTAATFFWLQTRAGASPSPDNNKESAKSSKKETYCTVPPPPGTIKVIGPDGTLYD